MKHNQSIKSTCLIAVTSVFILLRPQPVLSGEGSVIRGRVVDMKTREPVHFANVFLSNTTIGAATAADGAFTLERIAPGNYQLVVHHIAYEPRIIPADMLTEKQLTLVVELEPRVLKGEQVEVTAKREKGWRKHLDQFREALLGGTENARSCEILNPEVLDFKMEKDWLTASSDSLVHIRNNALGYDIDLYLKEFAGRDDEKQYQIYPVFHEYYSGSPEQVKQWRKNRLKSYQGSFRHFLSALYNQNLYDEGMELYEIKRVGNKVYTWGSQDRVNDESGLVTDSDFPELKAVRFDTHYMVLSHHIPRKTDRFIEEAQKSNFYQLEFLEPSFFSMNRESALIDSLGNIHTPNAFAISGYWGLFGVADLLPFNYDPSIEEK